MDLAPAIDARFVRSAVQRDFIAEISVDHIAGMHTQLNMRVGSVESDTFRPAC